MIKYHSFKVEHIVLSLALFVVGAFFGIFTLRAELVDLSGALTGMFPSIESNHSSIHFNYGGNDFMGMIFWTTGTALSSPEIITMS